MPGNATNKQIFELLQRLAGDVDEMKPLVQEVTGLKELLQEFVQMKALLGELKPLLEETQPLLEQLLPLLKGEEQKDYRQGNSQPHSSLELRQELTPLVGNMGVLFNKLDSLESKLKRKGDSSESNER